MKLTTKKWYRGLIAAFIGASTGTAVSILSAKGVGLNIPNWNLETVLYVSCVSGLSALLVQWKAHPLPPDETDEVLVETKEENKK